MKKVLYLTVGCVLALSSCTKFDFDENRSALAKENAENIFGIIDPNQDWSSINSGSVTVTADAPLKNIAKVQILTESPFLNSEAKILAEEEVTKGQTVTLNYDAPKINERLIVACVDNNGNYYIKGFNVGEGQVSFKSTNATRAAGFTRASSELPDFSRIELKFSDSFLSFNANRALSDDEKYSNWKGKNWEKDRLWCATSSETSSGGWTIANSTIYRDATAFSDEDKATLQDIFNASLYRDDPKGINKRRNNLALIREGNAVKFFSNHLVSNGKAAITLSPVQLASTEAYLCDIYYYYYKVENVPSGTSEMDYIKSLPKFKAIDLNDERLAFKANTGISEKSRDESFLRLHEYLLPFYGDANEFDPVTPALSHYGYTTDGKFYRIHNFSENKDHFITNADKEHTLKDAYTENVEEQLWQIFTNSDEGKVMFYNVGGKKFLWCNNGRPEIKDINEKSLDKYTFYIADGDKNPTDSRTKVYIFTYNKANCLKSDANVKLGMGGSTKNQYREWTFEEYTASSAAAITDFELPTQYYPASIDPTHATASAIIPDGYRIGFMIRKDNGTKTGGLSNEKYGCLYGCGELNTEINTFGQFKSAVELYGMELNDPRMATFTANGKTYLCFEEGSDTQYSDVILEIGGVTTTQVKKALAEESDNANQQSVIEDSNNEGESGIYMFDDIEDGNPKAEAYTMCFEDRPETADFDLNDVVLRCVRIDKTHIQVSIIATGALDRVEVNGIPGTCTTETNLNGLEVHEAFGLGNAEGEDRFINTQPSRQKNLTGADATYEVDESVSISNFMNQIYIQNMSQGGNIIRAPKKGEYPCAIIVPGDFNYPSEKSSIIDTYTLFGQWAKNANQYQEWILHFNSNTYTNPYNQ